MYKGPLFIASDHGGFHLKQRIIRYIQNELNQEITDLGPEEYQKTDDYPDYVIPLAHKVIETNGKGIVICRNGIGVNIAVNKVSGIRSGIGYNLQVAESMMQHDNTNIIALAADHLDEEYALAIIKKWIETSFSQEERHIRRLNKITQEET
ncbi:MAG: RpiB/LacA/LacB family sugar-phosphate isomerase [Candidatus Magasanikbacteria bacterium]|nr:RpiB/LacA/LacB family sugar-phosphate isomerase [Candidatus Magasanikbacteria bacterium]NCS71983.1 RpiB/LacA/LacB family sugar-phosphate isomerase [Candidatus Magasanikbacteria bacterium]